MDGVDSFSVLFTGNSVLVNKKSYPTGQLGVDVLNLDESLLIALNQQLLELGYAVRRMLTEDSDAAAADAQKKLNTVLPTVFELPVLRDLEMSADIFADVFHALHSDRGVWAELSDPDSETRRSFETMLTKLLMLSERLRAFQKQIRLMTESYLDTMSRRGVSAYADAFLLFYNDMLRVDSEDEHPFGFEQSFPVEINFIPMLHPTEDGRAFIAEQARFSDLVDFLEVEFYRALAAGNAPRRCHNCGRYFLLTEGYNTCYCNNIAPGETERTCRKVGAHRKEARGKVNRTPARREYDKAYNRLKGRKQRGKISTGEWNAAVAQAQDILARSERGELTDQELERILANI